MRLTVGLRVDESVEVESTSMWSAISRREGCHHSRQAASRQVVGGRVRHCAATHALHSASQKREGAVRVSLREVVRVVSSQMALNTVG